MRCLTVISWNHREHCCVLDQCKSARMHCHSALEVHQIITIFAAQYLTYLCRERVCSHQHINDHRPTLSNNTGVINDWHATSVLFKSCVILNLGSDQTLKHWCHDRLTELCGVPRSVSAQQHHLRNLSTKTSTTDFENPPADAMLSVSHQPGLSTACHI